MLHCLSTLETPALVLVSGSVTVTASFLFEGRWKEGAAGGGRPSERAQCSPGLGSARPFSTTVVSVFREVGATGNFRHRISGTLNHISFQFCQRKFSMSLFPSFCKIRRHEPNLTDGGEPVLQRLSAAVSAGPARRPASRGLCLGSALRPQAALARGSPRGHGAGEALSTPLPRGRNREGVSHLPEATPPASLEAGVWLAADQGASHTCTPSVRRST